MHAPSPQHLDQIAPVRLRGPNGSPFTHLRIARTGRRGPAVVSVGFPDPLACVWDRLPRTVPLYWLRSDGFYAPSPVIRPLNEMAAAFARELTAFAPRVPLLLVGFSFGGLLAAELTHQLRQEGRSVQLVMLEAPLPGILPTAAKVRRRAVAAARPAKSRPPSPVGETRGERLQRHLGVLRLLSSADRCHYLRLRVGGMLEHLDRLPWVGRQWQRRWLAFCERTRLRLEPHVTRPCELPYWCREWWYFLPQMIRRLRGHALPCLSSPVYLAGRPSWLNLYAASWAELVEGRHLHRLDLPDAGNHVQPLALRAARPWIECVQQWTSEVGAVCGTGC